MDEQWLKDMRARFGDRVEDWPQPFRAEALGQGIPALLMPTDEAALAQAVLTRLSQPRRPVTPLWQMGLGYAALVIICGGAGYGGIGAFMADPVLAFGWAALQ